MSRLRALALLLLAMSPPAWATSKSDLSPQDPSSRPPLCSVPAPTIEAPPAARFDGGHLGPLLAMGLALPDRDDAPAGRWGWDVRAGLRYATLLQLLDASAWVEYGTHPAAGVGAIGRTTLGLQVNLHPLFWLLVWDNLAGWLSAGLHGYVSTGAARVSLRGKGLVAAIGGTHTTAVQWAMHNDIGLGMDIPISGRQASAGLWLSLRWGMRWLALGELPGGRLDLGDQHFQLAIGWRSYASLSSSAESTWWVRSGGPSANAGCGILRSKSSQILVSSRQ